MSDITRREACPMTAQLIGEPLLNSLEQPTANAVSAALLTIAHGLDYSGRSIVASVANGVEARAVGDASGRFVIAGQLSTAAQELAKYFNQPSTNLN